MISKKYSFWLVGYSILTLMIGTNIPSPLYSVYKETYKFSSLVLTLIFATYALTLIPSLALFGKISDKIGRKKVIWLGLIMSVVGSVLFIFSNSVGWLFLARVFQGLAVGILSRAATAALMELNPYSDTKIAALVTSIATAGGTALGPLAGGVIAQYGPYPSVIPYVVHLVLAIPGIVGILLIEETVSKQASLKSILQKTIHAGENLSQNVKVSFMASAVTAFIAWSVTALFMSVIPSYVSSLLGIKNLALMGGVVFLMLGSSVLAQFVCKKLRYDISMRSGLLQLVVGLIGLSLAVPAQSITLLVIGTLCCGFGQGLAFKCSMELVNEIAPVHQRGTIVSKLYVVIYLGVGVPVIGVGTLAASFGLYKSIVGFTCIIALLSIIMISYRLNKLDKGQDKRLQQTV